MTKNVNIVKSKVNGVEFNNDDYRVIVNDNIEIYNYQNQFLSEVPLLQNGTFIRSLNSTDEFYLYKRDSKIIVCDRKLKIHFESLPNADYLKSNGAALIIRSDQKEFIISVPDFNEIEVQGDSNYYKIFDGNFVYAVSSQNGHLLKVNLISGEKIKVFDPVDLDGSSRVVANIIGKLEDQLIIRLLNHHIVVYNEAQKIIISDFLNPINPPASFSLNPKKNPFNKSLELDKNAQKLIGFKNKFYLEYDLRNNTELVVEDIKKSLVEHTIDSSSSGVINLPFTDDYIFFGHTTLSTSPNNIGIYSRDSGKVIDSLTIGTLDYDGDASGQFKFHHPSIYDMKIKDNYLYIVLRSEGFEYFDLHIVNLEKYL